MERATITYKISDYNIKKNSTETLTTKANDTLKGNTETAAKKIG
jgi:hypothetical protein